MSRNWEGNDYGDGPDMSGLYNHAVRRSIYCARGQKMLDELEAALLALPEHKLIAGEIASANGVCALGALAVHIAHKRKPERPIEEIIAEIADNYEGEATDRESMDLGASCGMSHSMAWEIGANNDVSFGNLTPERRWQRTMDWIARCRQTYAQMQAKKAAAV